MRVVERPQYNPFHDEDQYEMNQIRENRRYVSQNYRNNFLPSGRRYNLTVQNDPEAAQISSQSDGNSEIIRFIERDIKASDQCRQFFSLSTIIIISQVIIFIILFQFNYIY